MKLENEYENLEVLLERAATLREPIIVNKNHRMIGKTTALFNFARKHGYTVLVGNSTMVREARSFFDYGLVVNVRSINLDGYKGFVYDESCPVEIIEDLKNSGLNV